MKGRKMVCDEGGAGWGGCGKRSMWDAKIEHVLLLLSHSRQTHSDGRNSILFILLEHYEVFSTLAS